MKIEGHADAFLASPPVDPAVSSRMRRVGRRDTKPEMLVRRMLTARGLRYRLHRRDLPGSPDIVFPGRRKAIFVHGCFWHRHEGCARATVPATRAAYWAEKFRRNVARDRVVATHLREEGWAVLTLWECECKLGSVSLERRLARFLGR